MEAPPAQLREESFPGPTSLKTASVIAVMPMESLLILRRQAGKHQMIQSMKDGCISTVQCNAGDLIRSIKKRLPWAPWRRRIYLNLKLRRVYSHWFVPQNFLTVFYCCAQISKHEWNSGKNCFILVDDIFRAMTHQVQYMTIRCRTTMKLLNLWANTWQNLHRKKDRYRDTEIYQKWKPERNLDLIAFIKCNTEKIHICAHYNLLC